MDMLTNYAVLAQLIATKDQPSPRDLKQAAALWNTAGENWNGLYQMTDEQCLAIISYAALQRLKVAIEIGRRKALETLMRTHINSPADVASLLMMEMSHLDKEHLCVVILNTKNHVLKIETVTIGSLNTACVRIGEVFKEAIKLNAAAIILSHNHPSGMCDPSPDDIVITKQIIRAGQLLDVEVLDHLVIGKGQWVSMREKRLAWA